MANKKKPQKTQKKPRPAPKAPKAPRRRGKAREMSLADLFKKRKDKDFAEFKPDAKTATVGKTLRLTRQQQLHLTKWVLYVLTVVVSLIVQDVIMSQFDILGATTDLAVGAILLITVIEGTEVGALFVLIASTLYYFSGTAPIPMSIGLMCFFGIGATLFRQMYWHRSKGSILLCSAIALAGYELGLFVTGLLSGLTIPSRILSFTMTIVYSCIALIPMYSVIYKIGMIGGNTWKE